jgi:hypothetical protein
MGEVVRGGREEVGGWVALVQLKVEKTALLAAASEGGRTIAEGEI